MISETVIQSLITAGAGFFGALVGAVAAVVGPWWLRRSDREAAGKAEAREARRLAIVEYVDAQIHLAGHIVQGDPETHQRSKRANESLTQLISLLQPGEGAVEQWLHGLSAYAAPGTDLKVRAAAWSMAGRYLFSWNRGELAGSDLKPFSLIFDDGVWKTQPADTWPSKAVG